MTKRDPPIDRHSSLSSVGIRDTKPDVQGFTSDCNSNGVQDICDISCGFPGEGCDVAGCGRSADCNRNGLPDECDIANLVSQGSRGDSSPGECKPCGTDADCDDGVFCNGAERCTVIEYCFSGPVPCTTSRLCDEDSDRCMPDCNNNGIIDNCDIACEDECDVGTCGSSFDCNGNDLPDECELGLQAKLTAVDGAELDGFGDSVALDGDVAVVGAPNVRQFGFLRAGAAYIYRFDSGAPGGWINEAKLVVSDVYTIGLGRSVAVSGDTVVVGAEGSFCFDETSCDAAYVYHFDGSTWIEEARLTAPNGIETDRFGVSVAISGDTIVAWAVDSQCAPGAFCSALYVYRFHPVGPERWVFEAKLTPSDAAARVSLGQSVAISNDTIVVEMHDSECASSSMCGAAYVYRFVPGSPGAWVEEAKLMIAGLTSTTAGKFVDISGDVVVVGVRGGPCPSTTAHCGTVYIYRLDPGPSPTWVEEAKITASSQPGHIRWLGGRVAISGDTLVAAVGGQSCFTLDLRATRTGCGEARVYRHLPDAPKNWVEVARLVNTDRTFQDGFANSITLSGDRALVGTPGADCLDGGYRCGAAHGFAIGSVDCNENGVPDECDVLPGGDFDADGAVDLSDWRWFTDCWAGPGDPLSPTLLGCAQTCRAAFDFDANGNVSLRDAADMLNLLSNR